MTLKAVVTNSQSMVLWFSDVNPDGEKRPPPYIPPPPPDDEEHIFETLMKGINFDKYDNIPVECTGRAAPKHGLPRSALALFFIKFLFVVVPDISSSKVQSLCHSFFSYITFFAPVTLTLSDDLDI